jgi:hypothetical protein
MPLSPFVFHSVSKGNYTITSSAVAFHLHMLLNTDNEMNLKKANEWFV